MVDCGEDWLGNLDGLHLHAIVITHAHPDHAFGLKEGAPCPVYATQITWEETDHYTTYLVSKGRRAADGRHTLWFPDCKRG